MNKDYEIYQAPEDTIPEEDKARLDGYLRGRSEAALLRLEKHEKKFASSIKTKIRK